MLKILLKLMTVKKICPICSSFSTKKNGKNENGQQRCFCKDCHKSFTDKTGTLLYWTHLSIEQWEKIDDYVLSRLTLQDTAHFVGISVTICFLYAHKLYHAATEIINK